MIKKWIKKIMSEYFEKMFREELFFCINDFIHEIDRDDKIKRGELIEPVASGTIGFNGSDISKGLLFALYIFIEKREKRLK